MLTVWIQICVWSRLFQYTGFRNPDLGPDPTFQNSDLGPDPAFSVYSSSESRYRPGSDFSESGSGSGSGLTVDKIVFVLQNFVFLSLFISIKKFFLEGEMVSATDWTIGWINFLSRLHHHCTRSGKSFFNLIDFLTLKFFF